MLRRLISVITVTVVIQINLSIALPPASLGQEWAVPTARGTIKVVDLEQPNVSVMQNYAEGLVTTDRNNKFVPCLAKNWRWIGDRTIEFKLRRGVTFHNGEEFNAEAVRINWEAYRKMENPRIVTFTTLPDETVFEMEDKYTVRFRFPEPDGLALLRFAWFFQAAPAFLKHHNLPERNWLYLPEPGPWATGPFELVEGGVPYGRPTDRVVLEAFEDYWDSDYPKVRKIIFDNTLIGDRENAVTLCMDNEGTADIVSYIRPLDTMKIAESKCAKVVKSKDVTRLGGVFNQRKRNSKWRDIRLRKGLNHAVNRRELWEYAAKGNAYNVEGFLISPGAYGHNPEVSLYRFDTKEAKRLISDAGYPDGFEIKIVSPEAWQLEARIVGKMLERVGLRVTIEALSHPEYMRKLFVPIMKNPQRNKIGI